MPDKSCSHKFALRLCLGAVLYVADSARQGPPDIDVPEKDKAYGQKSVMEGQEACARFKFIQSRQACLHAGMHALCKTISNVLSQILGTCLGLQVTSHQPHGATLYRGARLIKPCGIQQSLNLTRCP